MLINNGKTLKFTREFLVPVENLYNAWADRSAFMAWWKDLSVANMDFRKGGSYRLEWKNSPGDFSEGIYKEVIPNEKIVFTWSTKGCSGDASGAKDSLITLNFRATGQSTCEMDLIHDLLSTEAARDSHYGGWTAALLNLDEIYNAPKRDLKSVPAIHVTRTIPFHVEKVFEAWTNPKLMNEWFNRDGYTLGKAQCELKVGKNYRMDRQMDNGDVWQHSGEYLEIIKNEKLVFTWTSDCCEHESKVIVLFKKQGNSTEIDLTHEGLSTEEMRKGHGQGWTECLKSVEEQLTKASNRQV